MRRGIVTLMLATVAWSVALPSLAATDPATLMRRIAAEPYRYGGSLQGTVPGVAGAIDQPPIHLSIGLAAPDAQGVLRGDVILFDRQRRLVASGSVVGQVAGGACSLRLALPVGEVRLSGICTDATLSGEIVSRPRRPGLLTRLVSWWGDDAVSGRYWLTPASFDPGS